MRLITDPEEVRRAQTKHKQDFLEAVAKAMPEKLEQFKVLAGAWWPKAYQ